MPSHYSNSKNSPVSYKNSCREAAYLSAISAASVAYAVTRACSKGELSEYCSCDNKIKRKKSQKWKWGGCSDDIKYGEHFSRQFLDVREDQNTAVGLMNLHNNEAGRRGVRSRMQRTCKCHGVSGSCSMQICWRRLPAFKKVAEGLFQRYEGASHVKFVERRRKKLKAAKYSGYSRKNMQSYQSGHGRVSTALLRKRLPD
ncbi:hypothetical protein NQ314_014166 [Rhamnusium bicolor]|uniref:Protein Wnt n=1 Tax=Rhamnusium bicolor TaxID=1586634 RepID=A0AAV8X356_9CUCU|nr:hypothetical protein NQ314_014166 [Rhamnusium bicolor]